MITRRKIVFALGAGAFVPVRSFAQQPAKIPRIGFLSALSASSMAPREEAFRTGLREIGYVEGRTYILERRYAEANPARLQSFAEELVRLKVDVIVTTGPTTTPAAKQATATIPIVMGFDSDLAGAGLVASLARPGGNITGLSGLSPELSGKQLELLKEMLPKLSRVAVLGSTKAAGNAQSLAAIERTAKVLKIHVHFMDVRDIDDV